MATRGTRKERAEAGSGERRSESAKGKGGATAQMEGEVGTAGGRPRGRAKRAVEQSLPHGYGDNQIYAMVRDPHWLYCYWEIQDGVRDEALGRLGGSWEQVSMILRLVDTELGRGVQDVSMPPGARAWYLNVSPNRSYYVEIGLLHRDGRFIVLARSNTVVTPRAGMSEVIDEQWMGIDFDAMYALSGGLERAASSAELQRMMEERLQAAISSGSGVGALSSISSPIKPRQRGFWFVLDCELIVYGATEPDAKVTLQGKEVKLREDGTFSLRFSLPDGSYYLDAVAESSDGKEKRTIVPIVTRTTHTPEPELIA